jgi:hypothetical protein
VRVAYGRDVVLLRSVVAVALCLGVAACGQPSSTVTPTGTSSASVSASGPTKQDWCAAYSELTTTLASASPDPTGANAALTSLTQFDQLWAAAESVGILDAEEVAANRRAVASYRAVLEVVAKGSAADSPETTAARDALTAQTEKDRTVLTSSADKVLATCGAVTESPSP